MARMPETDVRNVWKEQLVEIQAELRRTTEIMMTRASASHQQDETGTSSLPCSSLVMAENNASACKL